MIVLEHADGQSRILERDELWIQYAVEHFRDGRGYYPPTLAVALAGHPNALIALDHLGWTRVHYELDATRGYVLAFLRPPRDHGRPTLQIEDRESYLKKLSALQQGARSEAGRA